MSLSSLKVGGDRGDMVPRGDWRASRLARTGVTRGAGVADALRFSLGANKSRLFTTLRDRLGIVWLCKLGRSLFQVALPLPNQHQASCSING